QQAQCSGLTYAFINRAASGQVRNDLIATLRQNALRSFTGSTTNRTTDNAAPSEGPQRRHALKGLGARQEGERRVQGARGAEHIGLDLGRVLRAQPASLNLRRQRLSHLGLRLRACRNALQADGGQQSARDGRDQLRHLLSAEQGQCLRIAGQVLHSLKETVRLGQALLLTRQRGRARRSRVGQRFPPDGLTKALHQFRLLNGDRKPQVLGRHLNVDAQRVTPSTDQAGRQRVNGQVDQVYRSAQQAARDVPRPPTQHQRRVVQPFTRRPALGLSS